MPGLFGTLGIGTSSLQTQRTGIQVAGQNLANVNNPTYSRQRAVIESAPAIPTAQGIYGSGVQVTNVTQVRDQLLDRQITAEHSLNGYWDARQRGLDFAQSDLGQLIDTQGSGSNSVEGANGVGGQQGIAQALLDVFNGFQSVATSPTSLAERQSLVSQAETLASRLQNTDRRLGDLATSLNETVVSDVSEANGLLSVIARLNDDIARSEVSGSVRANDLRDLRQARVEDLAKLVNITTTTASNGAVSVVIGGITMVDQGNLTETLETYDDASGRTFVRAASSGTPLTLTSGRVQGSIEARDESIADLRNGLDRMAALLITEVNAIHTSGYGLNGTSGKAFFQGTGSADISVNSELVTDPSLVQAADAPGESGNNSVALSLSQLRDKPLAALNNQTFLQDYNRTASRLGQDLVNANNRLSDQETIMTMLGTQRAAVSGVSLDEEMSDLVKFQQAFAASARLLRTVDEMLTTLVNL